LYSFAFPEPVRPEKVALIRGELVDEDHNVVEGAELEIKNLATKEVQNVKVNQSTGEYTTVVRMEPEQDLIVKVKSEGAAFSSRFIDSDKPGVIEADLAVSTLAVGKEYKLNDINFATNSYELLDKTMMVIDEFSIFLEENPRVKISIEGHTDNVGNASENKTLSQNRARVVYQYLIDLGIPASRMTYKGFGATRPVAGNDTEEGKQQNRRTVFRITSK
jgi:outer membrane protein OmpA-like peptidoglycan-associated protein